MPIMVAGIDKIKTVIWEKNCNLLKQKMCMTCCKFFTNVRLSDPEKVP